MISDLNPRADIDQASWFVHALSEAWSVDGLVPPTFEAYARVLHQVAADDDGHPVRWAEVATACGTVMHPRADFAHLAQRWRGGQVPRVRGWQGDDPMEGSLDRQTLQTLVTVVADHTSTPQSVWMTLWEGFGNQPRTWQGRPRVHQRGGYRTYYLFRCALDEVVTWSVTVAEIDWNDRAGAVQFMVSVDDDPEEGDLPLLPYSDQPDHGLQSPQQWWPDDRAWAVATEIDADFTIVGGSVALVEELVAHPDLDAFAVAAHDSLRDTINPKPPGRAVTHP